MKNFIIGILLIGIFCTTLYYEHNYTRRDCVVIEASPVGAIFEDKCGFTWVIKDGGYEIGQIVDLKMHDNCTNTYIYDDVIKKVIKRG